MTGSFVRSAAGAIVLLFSISPAFAATDPAAVAGLLAAAVAATGEATLTYKSTAASGDAITLTEVALTAGDGNSVTVPALVLSGVALRKPGGFTAAAMAADGGSATARGNTVTWATAAFADVVVPSADEIKARAKVRPFRKLTLAGFSVTGTDFPAPVAIDAITGEFGDIAAGAPANILVRATGAHLPASLLSNSIVSAMVTMLHYDQFIADITLDSEYDTTADTLTLHALSVDAADVGKLTIAGKVSHFSLRGMADPKTSAAARAAARLDQLTLRIDNAGFVERMLDMQAQLLGGTRDDVRSQIVDGALPFALSFVSNETFRDQFLAAVSAFLKDPHSLTITFSPTEPVPLGQAARTAARSPGSLPDLLALTVQANN